VFGLGRRASQQRGDPRPRRAEPRPSGIVRRAGACPPIEPTIGPGACDLRHDPPHGARPPALPWPPRGASIQQRAAQLRNPPGLAGARPANRQADRPDPARRMQSLDGTKRSAHGCFVHGFVTGALDDAISRALGSRALELAGRRTDSQPYHLAEHRLRKTESGPASRCCGSGALDPFVFPQRLGVIHRARVVARTTVGLCFALACRIALGPRSKAFRCWPRRTAGGLLAKSRVWMCKPLHNAPAGPDGLGTSVSGCFRSGDTPGHGYDARPAGQRLGPHQLGGRLGRALRWILGDRRRPGSTRADASLREPSTRAFHAVSTRALRFSSPGSTAGDRIDWLLR